MRHDLKDQIEGLDPTALHNGTEVQELGRNFIARGALDRRLLPWLWRGLRPSVADDPAQMDFLVELLLHLGLLTSLPKSDPPRWLLPFEKKATGANLASPLCGTV